jgi:hypothetical protein
MFEQTKEEPGTGRSRVLLMAFGAVIALAVIGVLLFSRLSTAAPEDEGPRGLVNARRAGDPVFEKYRKLVQLQKPEYYTQQNMIGQYSAFGRAMLVNLSDRTLTGVELTGRVIGAEDKLLAETVAVPVPRKKASIPPEGSMPVTVNIQNIPNGIKEKDIYDIRIELSGLVIEGE